jgi:phage FluMu protein Com
VSNRLVCSKCGKLLADSIVGDIKVIPSTDFIIIISATTYIPKIPEICIELRCSRCKRYNSIIKDDRGDFNVRRRSRSKSVETG